MFPERLPAGEATLCRLDAETDVLELYDRFRADREDVEEVFTHVPQTPYDTPRDPRERLEWAREQWADRESAAYAVSSEGDLAGYAGLFVEWDRRTGRLGTILARPFWGQGLATATAEALTEVAFEVLDLELVAIGHEAGNERSKATIERFVDDQGGQYDGEFRNWTPVGDQIIAHHRYTIDREEYRSSG